MSNWQIKQIEKDAVWQASNGVIYVNFDFAMYDLKDGHTWVGLDLGEYRVAEISGEEAKPLIDSILNSAIPSEPYKELGED